MSAAHRTSQTLMILLAGYKIALHANPYRIGVVEVELVTAVNINLIALLVGLAPPLSAGIYAEVVGDVTKLPMEVHVESPFI